MLIRYKDQIATLNNLYDLRRGGNLNWNNSGKAKYFLHFDYMVIDLACINNSVLENYWIFDTEQERDKVYNYIIDTYFVDIEKDIDKSDNDKMLPAGLIGEEI